MALQSFVLPWPLLSFLIYTQSIRLLGRGSAHRKTSMPRVCFEPTIPVFERAKTVHALDREATVIVEKPTY
jgi:hypothetical protein